MSEAVATTTGTPAAGDTSAIAAVADAPASSPFSDALKASLKSDEAIPEHKTETDTGTEKTAVEKPVAKEAKKEASKKTPFDFTAEKPADTTAPDPSVDPKSKEFNVGKFKKEAETYKAQVDALTKQLQEVQAKIGGDPDTLKARLEKVEKERNEFDIALKKTALEKHPEFQQRFIGGLDKVAEGVKKIVPGEVGERIAKILKADGGVDAQADIELAVQDLSPIAQGRIAALMNDAQKLHAEKDIALQMAATQQGSDTAAQQAQAEQFKAQANTEFQKVLTGAKEVLEVLQEREGDTEWNAEVADSIKLASEIFSGNVSISQLSSASVWAATGPRYRDAFMAERKLNEQLKSQLAQYVKASPSAAGGSEAQPEANTTFEGLFKGALKA